MTERDAMMIRSRVQVIDWVSTVTEVYMTSVAVALWLVQLEELWNANVCMKIVGVGIAIVD